MSFFSIAVIVPEAKQAQALALNQQKSFRQMNIPDLTDNELNIDQT